MGWRGFFGVVTPWFMASVGGLGVGKRAGFYTSLLQVVYRVFKGFSVGFMGFFRDRDYNLQKV